MKVFLKSYIYILSFARCVYLKLPLLQMLKKPGPYPLVVLPPGGGYWIDGIHHGYPSDSLGNPILPKYEFVPKIERDETAQLYRKFCYGKASVDSNFLVCFVIYRYSFVH